MVIRVVSVSDRMELAEIHDIFRTILGWSASRSRRVYHPSLVSGKVLYEKL